MSVDAQVFNLGRVGGLLAWRHRFAIIGAFAALFLASAVFAMPQQPDETAGGEASLKLPDLSQVQFLGIDGHRLLLFGILFCVFGLIFRLVIYRRLKNLPV